MKKQIRQNLVQSLWSLYQNQSEEMLSIQMALKQKNAGPLVLDHFAVIDLPGPCSGIPVLKKLFAAIGYEERGTGYLAEKQNDFVWMAESDCMGLPATWALPQVVVADFRLHEMPEEISAIIKKYAAYAKPSPLETSVWPASNADTKNARIAQRTTALLAYLSGRDWPLPTVKEFRMVQAFNELLAWVLVFGRRPNHFTLAVHLLNRFVDLHDFHAFIENEVGLKLNQEGGALKGGKSVGIAQGSTKGAIKTVDLADGTVQIPTGFMEFVWRYPVSPAQRPMLWQDFFTGFIATQANQVIESLYRSTEQP